MADPDPLENSDLQRLRQLIYLAPVVGVIPALWRLAQDASPSQEKNVCKTAVSLGLAWLVLYLLLGSSTVFSEAAPLRLLISSSLMTSGYVLTNLWLMTRVWRGRSVRLPGLSKLTDRLP